MFIVSLMFYNRYWLLKCQKRWLLLISINIWYLCYISVLIINTCMFITLNNTRAGCVHVVVLRQTEMWDPQAEVLVKTVSCNYKTPYIYAKSFASEWFRIKYWSVKVHFYLFDSHLIVLHVCIIIIIIILVCVLRRLPYFTSI